jgi:hypothetical protein
MTGPAAHPAQARSLSRPQQDTQGAHEEVRRSVHPEPQRPEAILKYPIMSLFVDEGAGLPSRVSCCFPSQRPERGLAARIRSPSDVRASRVAERSSP